MSEQPSIPHTNLYDVSQPIGLWRRRGALDCFIQTALGMTVFDWPEQIKADELGYHLWHYWAEGSEPQVLWDDLRMKWGNQFDYICAQNGEHPLHRLFLKGHQEAAKVWMNEAGWLPDAVCRTDTLWHTLAWNGDVPLFQMASQHLNLANINQQDCNGLTPVCIAVHRGGLDAVKHWLFLGADPDIPDETGRTLLHHIAQYGDISWFTEIQDMGAMDKNKNEKGQTPADVLYDRMKHGTPTDQEALRIYWDRKFFQKTSL